MALLKIQGVFGLDGEYPADLTRFTNRELHKIKLLSGLRLGEFNTAFQAGDNDVMVAFAIICLARAGKAGQDIEDALWDADVGAGIEWDFTEDEAADGPPEETPATGEVPAAGSGDGTDSGGTTSNGSSDTPPASIPLTTGDPTSLTTSPLSVIPQSSEN